QTCLAPDYLLVPADAEDAVVDGLKTAAAAMYPTILGNNDYTAIINARHRERLQALLDDAAAKGARIETVNPANEDFAAGNANKMPLSIVRGASDDMRVMQEEI